MTDRRKCRRCRYSGFTSSGNYWTGCTYIIKTGEKRPHDGDICYGYELKTDKRKCKAALKTSAPVITADAKRTESRSEIPAYEPINPRDGSRMWLNIMMM